MNLPPNPPDNPAHPTSNPPSPTLGPPRQERKPSWFRKIGPYFWAVLIFGVLASGAGAFFFLRVVGREPYTGPTWTVKKEKLMVTIVERGTLESAENSDIIVRVKAGVKGSTSASTIKWVIEDGSSVKAGDPVVDLDDSGFQDTLRSQKNTVNKAYFEWIQARNDAVIQAIQNISDIKTAEVALIQKELELRKYTGDIAAVKMIKMENREDLREYLLKSFEDDVQKESARSDGKFTSAYLQDISALQGTIETTRSDKETWFDRASWSQRMVKKGYYSISQADADQSKLESAKINLRKAEGDLDIYRKFNLEQNSTQKWSDVKEAERALKRVKIQAESKLEQKKEDEKAKKAIIDQELDRLHDMEKEAKFYKIVSPQDGMVVYYVPEQSRGGSGSQQSIVAQGEPVREGQKLIRIPNLATMLVNARVHEAMVSKLRGEEAKPTHYSDKLRMAFSMGRGDLLGLVAYQMGFDEVREMYKEKFRDKEQTITYPGQKAAIRVDAFPGKTYSGHVKSVATIASQADFLSSDVKVYQTMVSIEDLDEKTLKPGMSAEVTILADESTDPDSGKSVPVLVIPIQSVVGNVAMGAKRKCYVVDANGFPHERDIEVGLSSDKFVEIKTGLQEGETVVLNPRPLIPEKSDLKPSVPGNRRGADFDEGGSKKFKKKSDGDAGKGNPGPRSENPALQSPLPAPPAVQNRPPAKKT